MVDLSISPIISVAIVEDNDVYRELLSSLCEASPRLRLLAACSSLDDARRRLRSLDPDVILVDLGLPDGQGPDAVRQLRQSHPRSECLVLTVYDDDRHLFAALETGASGYLLKEQTDEASLIAAIQETVQGGAPMSASIARRVLQSFRTRAPRAVTSPALTTRENEIMERLAQGHSARKIAQLLNISHHTVRCHQKNIYKKLHVKSVLEAVAVLNRSAPLASETVPSGPLARSC